MELRLGGLAAGLCGVWPREVGFACWVWKWAVFDRWAGFGLCSGRRRGEMRGCVGLASLGRGRGDEEKECEKKRTLCVTMGVICRELGAFVHNVFDVREGFTRGVFFFLCTFFFYTSVFLLKLYIWGVNFAFRHFFFLTRHVPHPVHACSKESQA